MSRTLQRLAFALAALLLFAGAATAQTPVADLYIDASEILWHSKVAGADKLTLTVSGPGGVFTQSFDGGDIPYFGLFDKDGYTLADGQYAWQLTVTPQIDDATKQAMADARANGEEASRALLANLPKGEKVSGSFRILDGAFVSNTGEEAVSKAGSDVANKDQVFLDDLIVDGSACIGVDCANGESFGFDTLRLKENNLRIKFDDTSSGTGSFPSNDWQLTANDSDNGGTNKFAIDDITGGKTPFTVVAGAPNNSLYINSSGNIGVGEGTPVVELHIADGDSPTLRLEQDGSSGFTAQTWDIAGNETNFFVRDVTNGSKLSFRIKPSAPENSIFIDADGDVGLGTASPDASLDVERTDGASILVQNTKTTTSTADMLHLKNQGSTRFAIENTNAATTWRFANTGTMQISLDGSGETELELDTNGNLTAHGTVTGSSDINLKKDIVEVDTHDVLDTLSRIQISHWTYKTEDTVHMGPMAQDFYAAFGLGADNRHISFTDTAGVAFAAIQALDQQVKQKDAKIEALEERLAAIEALLAK